MTKKKGFYRKMNQAAVFKRKCPRKGFYWKMNKTLVFRVK